MNTGQRGKAGKYSITESKQGKEMSKFVDQQNRIEFISRPMHMLSIEFDKRHKVVFLTEGAGTIRYPYGKGKC